MGNPGIPREAGQQVWLVGPEWCQINGMKCRCERIFEVRHGDCITIMCVQEKCTALFHLKTKEIRGMHECELLNAPTLADHSWGD